MITCNRLEDLPNLGQPLHLAVGVFDGVHIGHQQVIARAVTAATREGGLSGLLTFDPHPCRAVRPDQAPPSLMASLEHKAMVVKNTGIQVFIPLAFDAAFAAMEATDFLDQLMATPVKTIAVGEDWRFGRNRLGDVTLLSAHAKAHGIQLETVPPVRFEGDRISSTRIRHAIRHGDFTRAEAMLGRRYSIRGPIIHGDHLGRTLGFPTANVQTDDAQLPPDGVWAVLCTRANGDTLNGVANLGLRPTVAGSHRRLEVHLLDFAGDLYGQTLEVQFHHHLRQEIPFASLELLRQQIALDVTAARRFFGMI